MLRLETPGPWSPYQQGYADLFSSTVDNEIRQVVPRATLPPRPLVVTLPPGASLRFPGRFAPAPLDYSGAPIGVDYTDLMLRLPAGTTGEIPNPFILHALRGTGVVALGGQVFEIGSAELQAAIDGRTDPLERMELLEAQTAIEVIYLLNKVRWTLGASNTLELRKSAGANLLVTSKATGDPAGDSDLDLVFDDGDASGVVGDRSCGDREASGCDDNCVATSNGLQLDADADGAGNACDGDFDQDELITNADLAVLQACIAGVFPLDDPACSESDLTEDGLVDLLDRREFDQLRGVPTQDSVLRPRPGARTRSGSARAAPAATPPHAGALAELEPGEPARGAPLAQDAEELHRAAAVEAVLAAALAGLALVVVVARRALLEELLRRGARGG